MRTSGVAAFVVIGAMRAVVAHADTIALLDTHVPTTTQMATTQQQTDVKLKETHEPAYAFPSGDEMTDRMTELGNELGHHMNLLSHDMISLQFDGRARHAKMRFGAGDDRFVTFKVASDIQFIGSEAHVRPHLELGFQQRHVSVDLPEFEIMPQSYQGDRVVVFLVPFFQRSW